MNKILLLLLMAGCVCVRSAAQDIDIALLPRTDKITRTDSLRRAAIMDKILALSYEIGTDNRAISRLLTNIAISMIMRKEDHIDQVVNSFTNSAIDAQIQWIIKERKELDELNKLLLNSDKK